MALILSDRSTPPLWPLHALARGLERLRRPARRLRLAAGALLAAAALPAWASHEAETQGQACDGAERIHLRTPVELSAAQRAALQGLPPLRVAAVNAPPLAVYDPASRAWSGIAVDVLCFIARRTGLRYTLLPPQDQPLAESLRQVHEGRADVFLPLSQLPGRERQGLFTAPYHQTHYVAIARRDRHLAIAQTADLAHYRVGTVAGTALEPALQALVPAAQLLTFAQPVTGDGLFQALRAGAIDVAVFNQDFFRQERYRHELFDLEIVHTLREHPRAYRFYFGPTPRNAQIVAAFDRYLAAIDLSDARAYHEDGERRLIERYVAQRDQRTRLQLAAAVASTLALASLLALRRYRRLTRQLAESHQRILLQQQALQAANAQLQRRSQTDGLTRLANRRHFDQTLAREHARQQRTGAPLSLLLIDVDHFKGVNDRFGHALGDDYLRAVARVLASSAGRATDLAARYGGEEFACLLPDTDGPSAQAVAERIRAGVAQLQLRSGVPERPCLTVSIGVATAAGGRHGAQQLLHAADLQLYAAKHAGRDCVRATVLD